MRTSDTHLFWKINLLFKNSKSPRSVTSDRILFLVTTVYLLQHETPRPDKYLRWWECFGKNRWWPWRRIFAVDIFSLLKYREYIIKCSLFFFNQLSPPRPPLKFPRAFYRPPPLKATNNNEATLQAHFEENQKRVIIVRTPRLTAINNRMSFGIR